METEAGHCLMILRFPGKDAKDWTVAVAAAARVGGRGGGTIVGYLPGLVLLDTPASDAAAVLAGFRWDFYQRLVRRADALFELTDTALCTGGPAHSLVDLSLAAEHRRGHGALYDGLNSGRIDIGRLRVRLAGLPLPRTADGRIVLARDVTNWLRPDASTSADRLCCHVYGRAKVRPR
ncbi:hypothetical protein A6A27_35190 [Micromonospora sp. CB01531]|nr:transposase [Micromonospora sp. CB01531]OKI49279.1 hypothetical protein A6A27_35190 [Micromonospora sp. CB01531]